MVCLRCFLVIRREGGLVEDQPFTPRTVSVIRQTDSLACGRATAVAVERRTGEDEAGIRQRPRTVADIQQTDSLRCGQAAAVAVECRTGEDGFVCIFIPEWE